MSQNAIVDELKLRGYRDTRPRRAILSVLERSRSPLSASEISAKTERSSDIDPVTVYRAMEMLEREGFVHRHPCDGAYSLCTLVGRHGHHGFLHCASCGNAQEFASDDLCAIENTIATQADFSPTTHVSEIIGTCARCSR